MAVGVAALALASLVTVPKVIKMFKIRGVLEGAWTEEREVTAMWHQTPEEHDRGSEAFWVSWDGKDVRVRGNHRLNLPEELWNEHEVGGLVELTFVQGDPKPYHREGIFANNGNFLVDFLLLGLFLLLAFHGAKAYLGLRRQQETRSREPLE